MTEVQKLKQIRAGHKLHVSNMMGKCKTENLEEAKILLATMKRKQTMLEGLDNQIMEHLTVEADIMKEIKDTSEFHEGLMGATTKLEMSIEWITEKMSEGTRQSEDVKPVVTGAHSAPKIKSETQIKLPKITLKEYDGSLLQWTSFWDQFEASGT